MRINRHSISVKVMLPWFILLFAIISLVFLRLNQLTIHRELDEHSDQHLEMMLLSQDIRFLTQDRWTLSLEYATTRNPQLLLEMNEKAEMAEKKVSGLETLIRAGIHDEDVRVAEHLYSYVDSYEIAIDGHWQLYQEFLESVDAEDRLEQEQMIKVLADKFNIVRATLDDLVAYNVMISQNVAEARLESQERAETLFTILLMALVCIGTAFSIYQVGVIVKPMRYLTNEANAIENGTSQVIVTDIKTKGELADLGNAMVNMVESLNESKQKILDQNEEIAQAYARVEQKVEERTEELRNRTEELEVANKDLEAFSYSVSHDLRAPLRAINGFISIIEEDYAEDFDDECKRYFGIVRDNAIKMGKLIDDVLAFSRASRSDLQQEEIDMNKLVDTIWQSLKPYWDDREIEFVCDDLLVCKGDPRAISEVWQNLLANAIKFTKEKKPAVIEVSSYDHDVDICYTVKDNGVGFNQEYSHKLFVLFQRLHGVNEFKGTGVGLALSKRFLQKHHGKIWAESELGKGAKFSFSIPKNIDNYEEKEV